MDSRGFPPDEPAEVAGRTPRFTDRLFPQASVRTQLTAAALMWLVGASILIVRGSTYLYDRHWHAWALAAGLVLGVLKSRYLLERAAGKSVARVHARGRGWLPGFFSPGSWALVAVMMGGGIVIRNSIVAPDVAGAGILGAVYVGVGTALFWADRVFWHAAFRDFDSESHAAG